MKKKYLLFSVFCCVFFIFSVQAQTLNCSTAPTAATTSITGNIICSGESAQLIYHGGSTGAGAVFNWYTDAACTQLAATGQGAIVSPASTTTYYGRYEDPAPCSSVTATASITLIVNNPPAITATEIEAVNNEAGICGASVTMGSNITINAGTSITPITYSLTDFGDPIANPYTFPVGITTVYAKASNSCGNDIKAFTVTVTDNEKPIINCPGDITLSTCTPTATWLTPTASDNCSVANVTQTGGPVSGSTFAYGSTTLITYTATDAYGNKASCSFNVTRAENLVVTGSSSNPHLYFGAPGDQTSTITATATGGTAPYTITFNMNRALISNYLNDAGDEVWTATGSTTTSANPPSVFTGIADGGSASINVGLLADADITATVTDANGCSQTSATVPVTAEDARCFAGKSSVVKVSMCHLTNSAKNPRVQICVDQDAVQSHLDQGDILGSCSVNARDMNLNAAGSSEKVPDQSQKEEVPGKLSVTVMPNPASYNFTLILKSLSNENVKLTVMDITGRVIEKKTNVSANSTIQLGDNYHPGVYILKLLQDKDEVTLRLIKEGK